MQTVINLCCRSTSEYMSKTFIDAPSTVASFVLVDKNFPAMSLLAAGWLTWLGCLSRASSLMN
jgi:hypothetical protein